MNGRGSLPYRKKYAGRLRAFTEGLDEFEKLLRPMRSVSVIPMSDTVATGVLTVENESVAGTPPLQQSTRGG
jgi:hypothetical protein